MTSKLAFVSVGCNRVGNCICWGRNDLIAFGGGSLVALYDPCSYRIQQTLVGHTARINGVLWLTSAVSDISLETELASASTDKSVIIWRQDGSRYAIRQRLQAHTDAVSCVASVFDRSSQRRFVASCGADGNVCLWARQGEDADFVLVETLKFGSKLMESVTVGLLPPHPTSTAGVHADVLLACGGIDHLIHTYTIKDGKLLKLASLSGHTDWIRSLQFARGDSQTLLLASAAQDNFVRVWKITPTIADEPRKIGVQQRAFDLNLDSTRRYSALLHALLIGHEDWVYTAKWQSELIEGDRVVQPLCLLTASMDRTMMLWRPDAQSGIWTNTVRVGEAGGLTLGFYGAVMSPDGTAMIAHAFNGALHLWRRQGTDDSHWVPDVVVSGHYGPVEEAVWEPQQRYFASVSADQTTRVFAPWLKRAQAGGEQVTWHEMARAQIHGYDMNCVTFLNGTEHRIVSGGDEKVLRVFDAPQTFIDSLEIVSDIHTTPSLRAERPLGASVPALGLTNKAVVSGQTVAVAEDDREGISPLYKPEVLSRPPLEEALVQQTLWAESFKLYGHGNEVSAVTCSHKGDLIASACKSTSLQYGGVWLWKTNAWHQTRILNAHKLTVTQIEFSHDDSLLLVASRDRTVSLWKRTEDLEFTLVSQHDAHDRIVWSVCFSPTDQFCATASRDKLVKIWRLTDNGMELVCPLPSFGVGVTAVAWAPFSKTPLIAVGLEDGALSLWRAADASCTQWSEYERIHRMDAHCDAVRRLQWRWLVESRTLQVLSCSMDHSVRLCDVTPIE